VYLFAQMQNKGEMAQQLFDIILDGRIKQLTDLTAPRARDGSPRDIKTSAGPPPQRNKRLKRTTSTTPDMGPMLNSDDPPVMRLAQAAMSAHMRSLSRLDSKESDKADWQEETHQRRESRPSRQPPIFIRKQQEQLEQQERDEEEEEEEEEQDQDEQPVFLPPPPQLQPRVLTHPLKQQQQQQQQHSFLRPPSGMAKQVPVEHTSAAMMTEQPLVLLPADGDSSRTMTLMAPPTVPSGVCESNERADPSLGCHSLGMARRGSFEIVKMNETAHFAANSMPRNCSIQNLTLMEESDKISEGTEWSAAVGINLIDIEGGAGGMLRSPSSSRLPMAA
jgi:hypothetical protein